MTRSIFAVIAVAAGLTVLAGPGCKATGVGDPCTPEQEFDETFTGFDVDQVNVESKSFQCQTRLCLVNHFQGLTHCPYGQDDTGKSNQVGVDGCKVPTGTGKEVIGQGGKRAVFPQCLPRLADKTVYCSCRCANINGKTDDGANYCQCPDGFSCTQLVTSIGGGDVGLTGAYCIKSGTDYDRNTISNPCKPTCDLATCK